MKKEDAVTLIREHFKEFGIYDSIAFSDHCEKLLTKLEKAGMYPPLNKLGIELAHTSDHDNRDIGYVTKKFLKWDD